MFAEAEAAQAVTRDLQFIPATKVPRLLSEAVPFSICSLFGQHCCRFGHGLARGRHTIASTEVRMSPIATGFCSLFFAVTMGICPTSGMFYHAKVSARVTSYESLRKCTYRSYIPQHGQDHEVQLGARF
jgi:hypothetical protein